MEEMEGPGVATEIWHLCYSVDLCESDVILKISNAVASFYAVNDPSTPAHSANIHALRNLLNLHIYLAPLPMIYIYIYDDEALTKTFYGFVRVAALAVVKHTFLRQTRRRYAERFGLVLNASARF